MGAQVSPVHLSLTAGGSLEADHRFPAAHSIGPSEVPQDGETAGISLGPNLLEQNDGGEFGELGQTSKEIVLIGLELGGRALLWSPHRRSVSSQGPPHRVARDA